MKEKNYIKLEMTDKNKNYNDTNRIEDNPHLQGKETCFGVKAVPGELHQSFGITCKCNSCGKVTVTKVESMCNCKAYLCCYYYGCYFFFHQLIKAKDFTLKDGAHHCGECNALIQHYEAC